MTSKFLTTSLVAAVMAVAAAAQADRIYLVDGKVLDDVRVKSFDVRNLEYTKGGNSESVATDRVARVELGQFKEVYARGLRDADLMLTIAREQLAAGNTLMAQMGFVGAAARFFDSDRPPQAVDALNELQKELPEAGVLPEVYRQKFEYYMGIGPQGANNAQTVAKKYENDAIGGAWPAGFATEASFFQVLSAPANAPEFQTKLRDIVNRARGNSPVVANRANIELAHSLRASGDADGAKRIYEDILQKDGVDASSRAGAYLGLGIIQFDTAGGDKEQCKEALLNYLRVRLETRDAWPALHAEALYRAILAADKWRGPEYAYIMSRCRAVLLSDFRNTEWAEQLRR
jgi:hypothetical protein